MLTKGPLGFYQSAGGGSGTVVLAAQITVQASAESLTVSLDANPSLAVTVFPTSIVAGS